MNILPRTRLAILGTMSDLHNQPVAYDLQNLQSIVAAASPDLLCAEVTLEDWERAELSKTSLEVREALLPIIASTDIVLIPVAPNRKGYVNFGPEAGWRLRLVRRLDRVLRWGQTRAGNAQNVNGPWFGLFCHSVCWLTELLWTAEDRSAWEAQNQELVENLIRSVDRDRGRRVLLVVQCQRLHQLIPLLRANQDRYMVVPYQQL